MGAMPDLMMMIVPALLVFARAMALLYALPIFGRGLIPIRLQLVLAAGLTVALVPPFAGAEAARLAHVSGPALVGMLAIEVLAGSLIGFVLGLLLMGARIAGTIVGYEMGFMLAGTIDPESGAQTPLMAHIYELMTMMVFLALNGHHFAIQLLSRSLETLPPGGAVEGLMATGTGLIALVAVLFDGALRIAAPLFSVLLLVTVGLALLAKAVSQFNILDIGFPTRILVGLLAAGVLLPPTIKGAIHLFAILRQATAGMVESW